MNAAIQKVWAQLSATKVSKKPSKLSAQEVKLGIMQDADELYDEIVKNAQVQAGVLIKVENDLNALVQDAKRLQEMEQKLDSMAKELGVDLDLNYAADTWVSDLTKYADEVGVISNKL